MFHRIRALFKRYERRHRAIAARGFRLTGVPGHVDRVELRGTRLRVMGWSAGDRITISTAAGSVSTAPHVLRQDVAQAHGLPLQTGFDITLPHAPGVFTITVESDGKAHAQDRVPVSAPRLWAHRLGLAGRFATTAFRVLPSILRVLTRHDPQARDRVKYAFGLEQVTEAGGLDPRAFATPGPGPEARPVTIVLPVYNAFDLLQEALARVRAHTDLPWHLVAVEDCSSDPRVRPFLRDWVAGEPRAELIENPQNLGFIGAVNRGLARAAEIGDHVVLLNSDALVPEGWASRLMRPILSDAGVASVTPMSNDAEIFTMPVVCKPLMLEPGQGDALDRVARRLNAAHWPVTPTGVGFCMGMNRAFLAQVPDLDTSFGRGYGEEVDWCRKTRAKGGRHVAQPALFVEHRGGTSFGSAEKQALILKNNARIARRYPGYDTEVQDFIAADPLAGPRLALALAWAGTQEQALPVYMAHSLGGGAENYLQARIAGELAAGLPGAAILRVGGPRRWQVELYTAQGMVAATTDDFTLVESLLKPLPARHLIYSCGVGDRDPVTLPPHLLALKTGESDRITVLMHDFFPLSPAYTLLDADGVFRGPPKGPRDDPAHQTRRTDGTPVDLPEWQAAWGALMAAADEITVFSDDSRAHVLAVYPDAESRITVCPHALTRPVPRIHPPEGPRRVIGILGNIGHQKGAEVVAETARRLGSGPDRPGMVIVGNVDPAYMPPAHVTVHGDYTLDDLPALVARYGITDWLIPSIWPETFSYTTHECLATGMPVHAFALGAQGAAVAQAENGHVIHFDPDGDLAGAVLAALDN